MKIIFFVLVIFIIISKLVENLNSALSSAFCFGYSNVLLVILENVENKKVKCNKLISKTSDDE
jgi:hypothetical protein